MKISIRGDSVAAWCCAHLLRRAGFDSVLERSARARLPAIMLGDAALTLMRDVFERPNLFRDAPRITRRVVQWGQGGEALSLDHSGAVVSEEELLRDLEQSDAEKPPAGTSGGFEPDFTIFASRPLPAEAIEHCFGSRLASAVEIRLKDTRDSAACCMESLENGWLFLIPNALESGWLLSVGRPPRELLDASRLIAGRIASVSDPVGKFPSSPRIYSPVSGAGWLACGTAAMAFDPICGDGTAHAVREAVLATAVVQAIASGGNAQDLLSHYEARLTLGFQRHLAASFGFYRSGGEGDWWAGELKSLERGLEWCAGQMKHHGEFRYQLDGFELKAIRTQAGR